jgi:hypothetical protein
VLHRRQIFDICTQAKARIAGLGSRLTAGNGLNWHKPVDRQAGTSAGGRARGCGNERPFKTGCRRVDLANERRLLPRPVGQVIACGADRQSLNLAVRRTPKGSRPTFCRIGRSVNACESCGMQLRSTGALQLTRARQDCNLLTPTRSMSSNS